MAAPLPYPRLHRRGHSPIAAPLISRPVIRREAMVQPYPLVRRSCVAATRRTARLEAQFYTALFTFVIVGFLFEGIAGALTRSPA